MGQFAMSRRDLLIFLGFVIPTLSNSKTHRFPNELFHEEYDIQRTSAIPPSAIDRRDAVRLDPRDLSTPSTDTYLKSSWGPYPDYSSTVPATRRRSTTPKPPKAASKFRKRFSHQDEFDFDGDSLDRSISKDRHSNVRGFNGASVEIKPEDHAYEFERIKKRRHEKKSKRDFEKKERTRSKYAFMKRSGEIAPSFSENEESANDNPSEEILSLRNASDQSNKDLEKKRQDQDSKHIQELHQTDVNQSIQRSNQSKSKEIDEVKLLEPNKKKRRKVLRVRHRNKNNTTNADRLTINAAFESLKQKDSTAQKSPVLYESKAVRVSNYNGNRSENNSKIRVKTKKIPKIIIKDTIIPTNKSSQNVWTESLDHPKKLFHEFGDNFNGKGESFKGISESDVLKTKSVVQMETENKSNIRNQNNRKSKSKDLDVAPPKKTSEHVWKEIIYSKTPSHEIGETDSDEYKSPKEKSEYRIFKDQTSNETSKHIKEEEHLRWPTDISDVTTTSEPYYSTLNSDKTKAKTTSRVQYKQSSKNRHLQDEDSSSSFQNNGGKSSFAYENPKVNSKPEWMQEYRQNVSNSDGNYHLSFNYKGDTKDQAKDVIKLHEEEIPKKLLKKAQEIPDKKVTSTKSRKWNAKKSKKESVAEKTPQFDNFDFSKRFKLQNSEEGEQVKENVKDKNYGNDYDMPKSNNAQVSFKKKAKKQPVEAIWKPAKPEEKSKNEQLRNSRSKSRSNIWSESGHFSSNDDENSYPNQKEFNFDKFPKTREKAVIPIQKDPVVKTKSLYVQNPRTQPIPSPNEDRKYFMTMFKRVGDLSLEHFDSDGSKAAQSDGYMSSIKLSWNDDDTRAHVDTSIDSRRQPFLFNRHNNKNNEYFNAEQNERFSGRTFQSDRNSHPELSSTEISSSKSKVAIPRNKRSTSEEKEHFFRSHFTLGKGGPSRFLVSSESKEHLGVPSEQKEIKKDPAVRSAVAPAHHRSPRFNKQLPNSEVVSYYRKPQDSKAIEQLTKDFHSKELQFPFVAYEKPARETQNVETIESHQTQKRTPNQKPKPKFIFKNVNERRNAAIFPRARNIQTIKHTNYNSSKPFFYHSYRSVPSEPKIFKSSFKLKPSFERHETKSAHLIGTENSPNYQESNKTHKASTETRRSKLQGRHTSDNTKLHRNNGHSSISNRNYPSPNKNVEHQEEYNEKNDKNFYEIGPKTNSNNFNRDYEREAETRLRVSKGDDSGNYQYSRSYNSAHGNPRSAKTGYSFEKDTWDQDFNTPEPRSSHPNYHTIPETHFKCRGAGYYADPEAGCQVFHMCQDSGEKHSFLCPNNTLFNQLLLVCDWQNKVNCENAESQYNVNERIYSSELRDKDEIDESPKWKNTQHVWSYNNQFPKVNVVSSRNTDSKNLEPESHFSFNSAFSKRKEFKTENEDRAKSTLVPSLPESRNSVPTAKPSFESSTKTSQNGELSFRNSKDQYPVGNPKTTIKPSYRGSYKYKTTMKPEYRTLDRVKTTIKPVYRTSDKFRTTIKPVHHTTIKSPTITNNDNLQRNYFKPKEYDYFKEHEYSVIHDISKPYGENRSVIQNSENPDKKHISDIYDTAKTHSKDHSVNHGFVKPPNRGHSINHDTAKTHSKDHSIYHSTVQPPSKDYSVNNGFVKPRSRDHSINHDTTKTDNKDYSVNHDTTKTHNKDYLVNHDTVTTQSKDFSVNRGFEKPRSRQHAVIHDDIQKPQNKDQSNVPETSTFPETNEERNNWEPSKLKQSVQPELRSSADSVGKFKETQKSTSRDGFVKKSTVRQHSSSKDKENSHKTQKNITVTQPQTEEMPTKSKYQWSQERKTILPTTFRNANLKDSTKSVKSNHTRPSLVTKPVEKEKPILQVRNDTSVLSVRKNPPRFDDNAPKDRKIQNSKGAEVKKERRIFKTRTLPQTGQNKKHDTSYRTEDSKHKSNLSILNTNGKLENPEDSEYRYPLPTTGKTGSSKDTLFGDRIENTKNASVTNDHSSRFKQEKPKRDADSHKKVQVAKRVKPSFNITSRIMDIMSGIDTIGTDVSKILDGKDHLYKNIQVHKMKPTNTYNGKVSMSLKSSTPNKLLNITSNSKRTDDEKSKTKIEEKVLKKFESRPKSAEKITKPHVIFEMYPKSRKYSDSSPYPNMQYDISDKPSKFQTEGESKKKSVKKNSFGAIQKEQTRQINKENPKIEFANYKKINELNLPNKTNSNPIEDEKKRTNVSESFQYFDLNPKFQPIESHLLHQPFEVETASESRESFREIRYVPPPTTANKAVRPPSVESRKSAQKPTQQKPNIERFKLIKKQSHLDSDHVIIPKNIFQTVLAEDNIPLKSLYPPMTRSSTSTQARFSGPGLEFSRPEDAGHGLTFSRTEKTEPGLTFSRTEETEPGLSFFSQDETATTQASDSESTEIPNTKPAHLNLSTPITNFSQNIRQKLNPTIYNFNKTERFLPGSRKAHSYINLPQRIIKPNSNYERQQSHRGSEYKNPLPSPKGKLPAFIFTLNPFSERPLLTTNRKTEQKPYILLNRPISRPASNLQYMLNQNQQESSTEQNTNPNYDSLEEDCDDSIESTLHNGRPDNRQRTQDGSQYLPSANGTPKLYLGGRSAFPIEGGLIGGRRYKCKKGGKKKIPQIENVVSKEERSSGEVPITQNIPNRASLVDSFVTLPKIPRYRHFAAFGESSPHSKSISKISDMLRKRGQLPPKPVTLFEGHEFLRPVISSEFFSKNIRTPNDSARTPSYKKSEFSEESSRNSEESPSNSEKSSEENIKDDDANRNYKYADLEKIVELKAEQMVKSTKPSA